MNTQNDSSTHIALKTARRAQWMAGIALVLLFAMFGMGRIHNSLKDMNLPGVSQDGEGNLYVNSTSDGPFVITHIQIVGSGPQRVAALSELLAIVDSNGMKISRRQIVSMKWRNYLGNEVATPNPDEKLTVLYFRPERAESVK